MCDLTVFNWLLYGWGSSSLGDFLAATSDRGLVAFEFADHRGSAVKDLQERFPNHVITEHPVAMMDTIASLMHLVDHPDQIPALSLDAHGTTCEKRVWELLRQIPAGSTTTYGAVAAQMGLPRDDRDVAVAIAANRLAILIPCHRAVRNDLTLAGYRWGLDRRRELLGREHRAVAARCTA